MLYLVFFSMPRGFRVVYSNLHDVTTLVEGSLLFLFFGSVFIVSWVRIYLLVWGLIL